MKGTFRAEGNLAFLSNTQTSFLKEKEQRRKSLGKQALVFYYNLYFCRHTIYLILSTIVFI